MNSSIIAWPLLVAPFLVLVCQQALMAAPGYVYKVINQADPGSGFFLRVGKGLFFVTAKHVLGETSQPILIQQQNGTRLSIPAVRQLLLNDVDLAVIPVTREEAGDSLAEPSARLPAQGDPLTVWGYPLKLPPGAEPLQARRGEYIGAPDSPKDGYELLYSSQTQVGFSGGPIVDAQGLVTGIHGRAEGFVDTAGGQRRTGRALGIPISILLQRLSSSRSSQPYQIDLAKLRQDAAIVSLRRAIDILSNASMSDQVLIELTKAEQGTFPSYCTQLARSYYYTFYSSLPDLAMARNSLTQGNLPAKAPAIYFGFASYVYKQSGNYARSLEYDRLAEAKGGATISTYSERQIKEGVLDELQQCLAKTR